MRRILTVFLYILVASVNAIPTGNGEESLPLVAGPFLKYVKSTATEWFGSVMIVSSNRYLPSDLIIQGPNIFHRIPPLEIDTYGTYRFLRYDINSLPMDRHQSTRYVYSFPNLFGPDTHFPFYVASRQPYPGWRWAFYSCNGFSAGLTEQQRQEMGGLQPLWRDLMRRHQERPFNCLVGGGDQLYADGIWKQPSLVQWLHIKGKQQRESAPWTPQMDWEAREFYFQAYMRHFSSDVIRDAFAQIPQVNMCDDHDFFDGLGSNSEYLERSIVFRELKRIGYHYYLLFQHHTTASEQLHCFSRQQQLYASDQLDAEYFGVRQGSYSTLKQLGPEVALLALDCRGERTPSQVLSTQSWQQVWQRLYALPSTVRHLIVVTGVPVVYPPLKLFEIVLNTAGAVKYLTNKACNTIVAGLCPIVKCFWGAEEADKMYSSYEQFKSRVGKRGMMRPAVNDFGEMDLNDDCLDHWTHPKRQPERLSMIHKLQSFAASRGVRVTFLAGDVHCCGVGRLYSTAGADHPDCRLMYQVISSAIGNIPPPSAGLKAVTWLAREPRTVDEQTSEEILDMFERDVDGQPPELGKKLLGRRNWCAIEPQHASSSGVGGGGLDFTLMVEPCDYQQPSVSYPINIPPLQHSTRTNEGGFGVALV
jgi:hypothetical protein